jgi:hypothetical protein
LFVVWGADVYHEYLEAFDDFNIYNHFKIFIFGAWSLSPYGQEMLDHFHVKDISKDMVDNPNVFLVCTGLEGKMFSQYMSDNYNMKIRPEQYFAGYDFNVYRVHSVSDSKQ